MDDTGHWDCWGWCGDRHVDRPQPNSTPEAAIELLLEQARLVFGEQDWSTWEWSAREYGTREPRVIAFFWHDGVWKRQQ